MKQETKEFKKDTKNKNRLPEEQVEKAVGWFYFWGFIIVLFIIVIEVISYYKGA